MEFFLTHHRLKYMGKWLLLSCLTAGLVGTASALFLLSLDWATSTRLKHNWLLLFLPAAGFAVSWVYLKFGREAEKGNNLLIEEVHNPRQIVKVRMAPLVFLGTVAAHLFGASVGREGTAVQMGGALSDQFARLFSLNGDDRKILLQTGISAGFSSVFGTPLAGAVFGLEVTVSGKIRYEAILPCIFASIISDQVCLLWGISHTNYLAAWPGHINIVTCFIMIALGIVFGLTSSLFVLLTNSISRHSKKILAYSPLRTFVGGVVIVILAYVLKADKYLGLGIPGIVESFSQASAFYDFFLKLLFTALSIGFGFKGGEVTPLFFIGATLGSALSVITGLPVGLSAAVGMVAVFAGAANTPLASTLMAVELFGPETGLYAAIACVCSYLFSGHSGIYSAQKTALPKCGPTKCG